jgi:hypothetical protein
MKAEEKAAYFAQYWGQTVISDVDNSGVRHLYPVVYSNMYRIEESHVELTPLSAITDEHLHDVANSMGYVNYFNPEVQDSGFWLYWKKDGKVIKHKYFYFRDFLQDEIDFLRSKSYALPFRNYSVEQLIEMGWLKLKES